MIQGIGSQGLGLLWAVTLGAALGLLYDLERGFRRLWPGCTVPMDLLFSLLFLLSLLGLALYTGGLRIYQLLGLGLGAAAYFLGASPLVLSLWQRVLGGLGRMGRRIRDRWKKTVIFLRKLAKKLFSTSWKWGTINVIPFLPERKSTPKRGAESSNEMRREKAASRRIGRLCGGQSGKAGGRAVRSGKAGTAAGTGHRSRKKCGR